MASRKKTGSDSSLPDQGSAIPPQLRSAFRAEELIGHRMAVQARLIGAAVIVMLVFYIVPDAETVGGYERLYFYQGSVVLIGLLAIVSYSLNKSRFNRPWRPYLFVTLDFMVITGAIFGGGLFWNEDWPAQLTLRNSNSIYLYFFIALLGLSYSPRLVIWSGIVAGGTWAAGVLAIAALPESRTGAGMELAGRADLLALAKDEHYVNLNVLIQEVVVMLLVVGILALVVWRTRRLAVRQVILARERANLARYFAPSLVDELAERDQPLGPVRRQTVGVLFVDMVKFTTLTESFEPEDVMALLREFHGRMEAQVFSHGGIIEKFIGDAMMATFGVPDESPDDALATLRCGRAILSTLDSWNAERAAEGATPIQVGVGAHYGPAVLGDIGSERSMSFAVIGNTTSIASRLQTLTRDLECEMVVSGALVAAARQRDTPQTEALLAGFRREEGLPLRGRSDTIDVWALTRAGQAQSEIRLTST